jgi:hypothetical protein
MIGSTKAPRIEFCFDAITLWQTYSAVSAVGSIIRFGLGNRSIGNPC